MTDILAEARNLVIPALMAEADPANAPGMQAYMKTDMPFTGCRKRVGP